jgi:spore germination protein GerM
MSLRRTPGLLAGVVAGAVVLGVAGCGVPTVETPVVVDPAEVPYGLLRPLPIEPTQGAAEEQPSASRPAVFYVTMDDRLVGVPLDSQPGQDALTAAIAALTAGPGSEDQSRGLATAIPPGLSLSVTRDGGLVTVDLGGEQTGPAGDEGPLAVGQIVLTATSVPGVDQVLLTRRGQPIEAQLPDGALTTAPLTAADFRVLVSPALDAVPGQAPDHEQ